MGRAPGEEQEGREPADPQARAREICLRLLAVRPRTKGELATALSRRGIPDEDAAAVLERYDEVGIVNDEAFARAWVSSRHHGRGLARGALARELRQRGVDSSTIGAALDEVDGDTEAETARALVQRRVRSMRGVAPDAAFRRLVGMLARKGYPAGLAVRIVRDVLAAASEEGAGFASEVDLEALTESVAGPEDAGTGPWSGPRAGPEPGREWGAPGG